MNESGQEVDQVSQALNLSVSAQVSAGSSDTEERADGTMYLNSSVLELSDDGSNSQIVGMRFTGLDIPAGATITNLTRDIDTGSRTKVSTFPPAQPSPMPILGDRYCSAPGKA